MISVYKSCNTREGKWRKLVLVGKRAYNSVQQPIKRNLKRENRLQKNPGFSRKHHLPYTLNKNQILERETKKYIKSVPLKLHFTTKTWIQDFLEINRDLSPFLLDFEASIDGRERLTMPHYSSITIVGKVGGHWHGGDVMMSLEVDSESSKYWGRKRIC